MYNPNIQPTWVGDNHVLILDLTILQQMAQSYGYQSVPEFNQFVMESLIRGIIIVPSALKLMEKKDFAASLGLSVV